VSELPFIASTAREGDLRTLCGVSGKDGSNERPTYAFPRGDGLFALIVHSSMKTLVFAESPRDRGHSRDPWSIRAQKQLQFSEACRTTSTSKYASLSRIILRFMRFIIKMLYRLCKFANVHPPRLISNQFFFKKDSA